MCTAASASATCRACASASLNTATERMPIRRRVLITRTAISPRLATSTVSKVPVPGVVPVVGAGVMVWSHPEHAVGDRLQRGLADDREGEPDNGSGVGRVDHPVVPQPCGG